VKCEINKDFYCSGGYATEAYTPLSKLTGRANWCYLKNKGFDEVDCSICGCYRRKHPTPEQFKEDYGWDYPKDGAAYALMIHGMAGIEDWVAVKYEDYCEDGEPLICACTPFGKPDKDWRPQ